MPPLPIEIPLWVKLVLWGSFILIGLLGAGLIFFLKRYIDKNDTHHTSVENTLKEHKTTFQTLTNEIKSEAAKIDKAAIEIGKANTAFQQQVNKELVDIHKMTAEIKSGLTEGKSQVGLLRKDFDELIKTVETHQKSLSLGAQAMAKQRDALAKIGSEVIKVKDDLILIKSKKQQS